MIGKNAGIRYSYKEQQLFYGKSANTIGQGIPFVKPPYTPMGIQHIPTYKYSSTDKISQRKSFPGLIKFYSGMKGENKGGCKAEKVNQQV